MESVYRERIGSTFRLVAVTLLQKKEPWSIERYLHDFQHC